MSMTPRTYQNQNGTVTSRIYQNGPGSPKVLLQNGYASIGRNSQHSGYTTAAAAVQLKTAHFINPFEHHGNDIVELNVGGCAFATTYHCLAESKSPYFKSIFKINNYGRVLEIQDSITKDRAGRIFINRDGDLFRYVLQYLRDGSRVALPNDLNILKMLKREAEFFSLQDFEKLLDHLLEKQINSLQEYPRQSQINEEMLELLRKMSHQQVAATSYNHNNSSSSNNNHMGLTQVNGIYR